MELCCPCEFTALSHEKQVEMFDTAKKLANYKEIEETYTHSFWDSKTSKYITVQPGETYTRTATYIYRPIRIDDLPKGWEFYIKFINQAFPDGEKMSFDATEPTMENYKLLYTWVNAGCPNCHAEKDKIWWDEGDKHIEYYCSACRNETLFTKHWRSYV